MTVESWLQMAVADAKQRGLPELEPLLEALARATRALRAADFAQALDDPPRIALPPGSRSDAGRT